jgi:hypothetical protein
MDKPGWIHAQLAMQWNVGTVFLLPVVITLESYCYCCCITCNFLEPNLSVTHRRHVCNIYFDFIYNVLVKSRCSP